MPDYLSTQKDFNLLSLKDLLEARDHYHVHLMHKENVVATAVGYYRIRSKDPWPTKANPQPKAPRRRGARTIENSEVRPYSWPSVLVFVKRWAEPEEFAHGNKLHPDDLVPRALYLPDGRVVPVCVIEAPRYLETPGDTPKPSFPINNIGGGYPVLASVQGEEYVASIGCLVTDGHKYYALTNRHVCGEPGEVLRSRLDGKDVGIGASATKQITRLPFQQVYADWPGKNVYVNLDVGLIDIDNLDDWSAKIRNVGVMGQLADLSINNISLRLIGCPVRAFGAVSGEIRGEIHGLFYRYKSVGGFEYVSDFLIGQRTPLRKRGRIVDPPPFATHPGDSGTLYLMDLPAEKGKEPPPPMPLALQWGGHVFTDAQGKPAKSFALATMLSTICSLLEVDLVRDWNLDRTDYWGAVGHYSIAANVANAISSQNPKLKKLMANNAEIISYKDQDLLTSDFKGQAELKFVPLADVPDNVWKHGKQGFQRPHEGPNHFADMDQRSDKYKADLLSLTEQSANIDPVVWNDFYDSVLDLGTGKKITREHRGLLPFRVHQIFQEMVQFVKAKKFDEFVCAAGILTHYIGDACQPLHISYLHDGDPEDTVMKNVTNPHTHQKEPKPVPRAAGTHTMYEDTMVGDHRKEILAGLAKTPPVKKEQLLTTGKAAAQATVELMRRTFKAIKPRNIVAAYLAGADGFGSRSKAFWAKFGTPTIGVMQDGTHLLAVLWESAWVLGGGEANVKKLDALTTRRAWDIYTPSKFLQSYYIDEIGSVLK